MAVPSSPEPVLSGAHIRQVRRALGWSQSTLARVLKVRQATVHDWEVGKTRPQPVHRHNFRVLLQRPEVQERLLEALRREAETHDPDEDGAAGSAAA